MSDKIEAKIQNILFTNHKNLLNYSVLFYKETRPIYIEPNLYRIPALSRITFDTYFNSCSLEQLKKYTNIDTENIFLKLEAKGNFRVQLIGITNEKTYLERRVLCEEEYNLKEKSRNNY